MIKIVNVIKQTAVLGDDGIWEALLESEFTKQVDDQEPETHKYAVKAYDTNLARALDVLDEAKIKHYAQQIPANTGAVNKGK